MAFIPPAMLLIQMGASRSHKTNTIQRMVGSINTCRMTIAGEFEPSYFSHPHWGSALPLRRTLPYCIGRSRSGCLRSRSCGSINFRYSGFQKVSYPSSEPDKLADQRANGNGEMAIIFGGAKSSANRTRKVACAANII